MSFVRRSINTAIWSDEWFESLEASDKLLWIYLLTNPRTNMIGIYELPSDKKLSFETGLSFEMIRKAFERFETDKKAYRFDRFIILINWVKNQSYNANMKKSAINDIELLSADIHKFLKSIDFNPSKGFETISNDSEPVETPRKKNRMEDENENEKELKKKSASENFPDSVPALFFNRDESFSKFYPIVAPNQNYIVNGVLPTNAKDEFKAWFNLWLWHLTKSGKKQGSYQQEVFYRSVKDWDYNRLREAIEFSIQQNYQTLIEPKKTLAEKTEYRDLNYLFE